MGQSLPGESDIERRDGLSSSRSAMSWYCGLLVLDTRKKAVVFGEDGIFPPLLSSLLFRACAYGKLAPSRHVPYVRKNATKRVPIITFVLFLCHDFGIFLFAAHRV